MSRKRTRDRAVPVGLFIILALLLLLGSVFWIRAAMIRPVFTFSVVYADPPNGRIAVGIPVYYRGILIGNVRQVSLASDDRSTVVQVGITDAHVAIPDTVRIFIETEGITGQRYVSVRPALSAGHRPTRYLGQGDVVRGHSTLTWEQVQTRLAHILDENMIERSLLSFEQGMQEFQQTSRSFRRVSGRLAQFLDRAEPEVLSTVRQFDATGRDWAVASHDVRTLAQSLHTQTAHVGQVVQEVNRASVQVADTTQAIQQQLTETALLPELAGAAQEIRVGVRQVSDSLTGASDQFQWGVAGVREAVTGVAGDVRGVTGSLHGQMPEDVRELDALLTSMRDSGDALERNLVRLRRASASPAGEVLSASTVHTLSQLAQVMQETAAHAQGYTGQRSSAATPAQLRHRLQALEQGGKTMGQLTRVLQPALQQQINHVDPAQRQTVSNLLAVVQELETMGHMMKQQSQALLPRARMLSEASARGQSLERNDLRQMVTHTRNTLARVDCMSRKVSHMLDQRFLGLRLMFGRLDDRYDCERVGLPESESVGASTGWHTRP